MDVLSDGFKADGVGNSYLIQIGGCFWWRRADRWPMVATSRGFYTVMIVSRLIDSLKMEC